MTLGERLRKQIDQQHKQVALTWLERWQTIHPDFQRRPNSVVAQFSRCLNDKPSGVRFFFSERERADLLFDILEIAGDQRESLWTSARGIIGAVVSPPAVVVDLTPWSGNDQVVVFNGLRSRFDSAPQLGPISLVLTRAQAELIPNGLASMPGVTLEPVERNEDGWDRVLDLAGDGTLVASKAPYDNLMLWLAFDVEKGKLVIHPEDGFETFARARVLPSPPPVVHSLFTIGFGGEERRAPLPKSAVACRRLIYELADADSALCAREDASMRAALARALDVDAAATDRERLEYELALLKQQLREAVSLEEATTVDDEALSREISLRKQRTMPAKLLRVGDQLHVLIETGQAKLPMPDSPRITVHEHTPKVVLRDFLTELESWGDEDYLYDPYFDRLLERLAPADETAVIYHHARAFLLATGHHPAPRVGERADWREALTVALVGGPPAAELLVPTILGNERLLGRPTVWLAADDGRRVTRDDELTSWWRHLPPASEWMAIDRRAKLSTFEKHGSPYGFLDFPYHDAFRAKPSQPAVGLLSLRTLDTGFVPTWQALLDASGLLPDYRDDAIRQHEEGTRSGYDRKLTNDSLGLLRGIAEGNGIGVVAGEWQRADEYLATLWIALGLAMRDPVFTVLHDGTTLLSLGGLVLVRMRVQTSPRRQLGPTRALLLGEISTGRQQVSERGVRLSERTLHTHRADTSGYTTRLGLTLPSQVRIYAGGYRLMFEFVASALLDTGLATSRFGAIGGSVAAQLGRDDEERYQDDDD